MAGGSPSVTVATNASVKLRNCASMRVCEAYASAARNPSTVSAASAPPSASAAHAAPFSWTSAVVADS
jgi:hypothetical protein